MITINLDVDLLPEVDSLLDPVQTWDETDVPLHERGIRMKWLHELVQTIDDGIASLWRQYREAQWLDRRSTIVNDILPPRYPSESMPTGWLVRNFIQPLTRESLAPLYARVPEQERGRPTVFLSHAWSSVYSGGVDASLDIALQSYEDEFVWLDIACYNQHLDPRHGIASDMIDVIRRIGSVAGIVTTEPFFTRSWCVWELVCAFLSDAHYEVQAQRPITNGFRSITDLRSSLTADRRDILQQLLVMFGSVEAADRFVSSRLRWASCDFAD